MARPMSDEEVALELNKMVAFIKQEALEKVREIRIKADEEFAIEKAKLVKQEQHAIDALHEKKRKQAEVAQKIAQSTLTNKSRLKLLHRREENIQDLFTTARDSLLTLSDVSDGTGRYAQFLEGIITEGLLQLLEPDVIVATRQQDVHVAQAAAENAKIAYKEISGRDVQIRVHGSLSDEIAGGVKLSNASQRTKLDNTLDERLRLLEAGMLPEIRTELFGPNSNRKFYT
ncbi:hypothetical protein M378DRAFT_80583 [Amanita muscaria Koide BX008]|uniref:Vacuolar ATP synthase subunit E n=1 Tax=Amanita muscaria (strain Koide BX008) TaxID=946122 RepID=A0A0C2SHZ5_AMAMK|nr:hypothetical protein M378DRAFT_80583 [Amanita muscaria Koide BX008]